MAQKQSAVEKDVKKRGFFKSKIFRGMIRILQLAWLVVIAISVLNYGKTLSPLAQNVVVIVVLFTLIFTFACTLLVSVGAFFTWLMLFNPFKKATED